MKVLYVSPAGASGPMMALLARCVSEVTCVAKPSEALDMIDAGYFSAVLIAEEIEDSNASTSFPKYPASNRNYWYSS